MSPRAMRKPIQLQIVEQDVQTEMLHLAEDEIRLLNSRLQLAQRIITSVRAELDEARRAIQRLSEIERR
jgi:hypothetical protein